MSSDDSQNTHEPTSPAASAHETKEVDENLGPPTGAVMLTGLLAAIILLVWFAMYALSLART